MAKVMSGIAYSLEGDFDEGFKTAVNNEQNNLALAYLVRKLDKQDERIEELEKAVQELGSKPAAPRKTTKKTTTSKETEEST